MNNQKGKADINMGKSVNGGKFSVTNIGLQNLAAPLFDNRGGSRLISIKDLLDKSDHGVTNVGQMAMDNRGGKADINIARAVEAGKFSTTNIGLQNLLIQNAGGSHNIKVGTVTDSSYKGGVHIGAAPVQGGVHTIEVGQLNANGFHTHDIIGNPNS